MTNQNPHSVTEDNGGETIEPYKLSYLWNTNKTRIAEEVEEDARTGMDTGKKLDLLTKDNLFDIHYWRRRPYNGTWTMEASRYEGGISSVLKQRIATREDIQRHDVTDEQVNELKREIIKELYEGERVQITAGKQDRDWIVEFDELIGREVAFQVHYTDEDKEPKKVVVGVGGDFENCNGTYYEYNPTCPHVQAVKQVLKPFLSEGDNA